MAELQIVLPEIAAPILKLAPPPVPDIKLPTIDFAGMQKQLEEIQMQRAIAENYEANEGIELGAVYEEPDIKPYVENFMKCKGAHSIQSCIQAMAKVMTAQKLVLVPGDENIKKPFGTWGDLLQTPDLQRFTTNNYGFQTGPSNLIVVDVDVQNDGAYYWNNIVQVLGLSDILRKTPCEMTTTGGYHYYFKGNIQQGNAQMAYERDGKDVKISIDIKSQTSYCRCAPSVHIEELGKDGKPKKAKIIDNITWIRPIYDPQYPLMDCPQSIIDLHEGNTIITQVGNRAKMRTLTDAEKKARQKKKNNNVKPIKPAQPEGVELANGDFLEVSGVESEAKDQGSNVTYEMGEEIFMHGLSDEVITGHDAGLKIIRACTHWAVAGGFEQKGYDLMVKFNKERRPESNMNDVGRLGTEWTEAKKPSSSIVTMRTILGWLKNCNPTMYAKMFGSKKATKPTNTFDINDEFYFLDFVNIMQAKVFDNYTDMLNLCIQHLPRVLAICVGDVCNNKGGFIKKDSPAMKFSIVDRLSGPCDFVMKYKKIIQLKTKTKEKIETITINKLIENEGGCFAKYSEVLSGPQREAPLPHQFIVWAGFKAKEVKEVDMKLLEPLLTFIKKTSANDDDKMYQYIISWLACICQNPAEKTKKFITFFGSEGAGKTTLPEFLEEFVFGYNLTATYGQIKEVAAEFNDKMKGKIFAYIKDMKQMTTKDADEYMEKLKEIITDKRLEFNGKGKDKRDAQMNINFMGAANYKKAQIITETDRRFVITKVGEWRGGNKAGSVEEGHYWTWLRQSYFNQDVGNHFYTYLLRLEGDHRATIFTIPQSDLRNEVIEMSKPAWKVFVDEYKTGRLIMGSDGMGQPCFKDVPKCVIASVFYKDYFCSWCSSNGFDINLPRQQFIGYVQECAGVSYSKKTAGMTFTFA